MGSAIVKKQYNIVNPENAKQQRSFLAYKHFYETGKLTKGSDYQTDLAILKQSMEDVNQWTNGKVFGKILDTVNVVAGMKPHPATLLYNFIWAAVGDEVKEAIQGDPYKIPEELTVSFIKKHSKNPDALLSIINEGPIGFERVQKTLYSTIIQNLEQKKDNDKANAESIAEGITETLKTTLKEELQKKQLSKKDILETVRSEIAKHGVSKETADLLLKQVENLSDKLTEYLNEAKRLKEAKARAKHTAAEIDGIDKCGQFLGIIAQFTGSKSLANVAKFVQRAAGVLGAVHNLSTIITTAGPFALAGGYAAIGIAAFSLISSFMKKGPSPEEIILDFLQDFADFVAGEFNKVHEKLHYIHEDIGKMLELQKMTLLGIYDTQRQIYKLGDVLINKLNYIGRDIDSLYDLLKSGIEELKIQSYNTNIRELDDLKSGHNTNLNEVQKFLRQLVGDRIRTDIYDNTYTGTRLFKRSTFYDLTPKDSSLFYSPLREIDNVYVPFDLRTLQSDKINSMFKRHDINSLLGFFIAYANAIQSEIIEKQCDTEKSTNNDQKEYAQKLLDISNQITELEQHNVTTTTQLSRLEKEIEMLCPGFNFLYQADSNVETFIFGFYYDLYRKFLHERCTTAEIVPKEAQKNLLQEKLNLVYDQQGKIIFDASSDSNVFKTRAIISSYQKALDIIKKLFYYKRKIDGFNLNMELLDIEKTRITTLTKLPQNNKDICLTDIKVFNPKLWILAVNKYLECIQHPKLQPHYHDPGLQHLYELIESGNNYLYLIKSLQEMPELFEGLWRSYATTLIHIHKNYRALLKNDSKSQEALEDYKKFGISRDKEPTNLAEKNSTKEYTPLDNELDIDKIDILLMLTTRRQIDFALEVLDSQNHVGFKQNLAILDTQKRLLFTFYQLANPDDNLLWLINNLWGANEIKMQLANFSNERSETTPFATLEVYSYLNNNYSKIAKYPIKPAAIYNNTIEVLAVTQLTARLEDHANTVVSNIHKQYADVMLDLSVSSLQKDNIFYYEFEKRKEELMKDNFQCLVDSALKNANMKQTKNAVLFIGKTRSGKSAFICYLQGCTMVLCDIGEIEDILIATDCPSKSPKIGHGYESQTLFPTSYKGDDNTYVDFPGLEDSRGSDEEMLTLLTTQVAIKTIKSIKRVVIIVDHGDIKNKNAKNLASIVATMSHLFKDFTQHSDAITMVVTKLEGIRKESLTKQKNRIISALTKFKEALEDGNYQNSISNLNDVKAFLNIIINSPTKDNLILSFPTKPESRKELLTHIEKSKAFSSSKISFVGDEKHKQKFITKIEKTISDALNILTALSAYPDAKKSFEDSVRKVKKDILAVQEEINIIKDTAANNKGKATKIPHTEQSLVEKQNEIDKLKSDHEELVAKKVLYENEIYKLKNHTKETYQEIQKIWKEKKRDGLKSPVITHTRIHDISIKTKGGIERSEIKCKKLCNTAEESYYINNPTILQKRGLMGVEGFYQHETYDVMSTNYKVTYIAPTFCLGKITINLWTRLGFPHNLNIVQRVQDYYRLLTKVKTDAEDKYSSYSKSLNNLKKMQKENADAQTKQKTEKLRAEQDKQKLENKELELLNLQGQRDNLQKQLDSLNKQFENNIKIFCVQQSFWERLIEFNNIIKLDFNQHHEFTKKFSGVNLQLKGEDCTKHSDPLECREFQESDPDSEPNTCSAPGGRANPGGRKPLEVTLVEGSKMQSMSTSSLYLPNMLAKILVNEGVALYRLYTRPTPTTNSSYYITKDWQIEHRFSANEHKFFYGAKPRPDFKTALVTSGKNALCKVEIEIKGDDLAYSNEHDSIIGLQDERYEANNKCSNEQLEEIAKDIKTRLPDYDELQRQKAIKLLLKELSYTAVESAATTGIILLTRDVMLAKGYSLQASEWGAYLVNQAFSVARVARSIWWGANYLTALGPLLLSNFVYTGLTKSGLTSKKTANWCSNGVSLATSVYSGSGLFKAVASFGVSNFVSYITAMGEEKFANKYLTMHLTKHCKNLTANFEKLKQHLNSDEQDLLDKQINKILNKIKREPTMSDYEVVHRYNDILVSILSKYANTENSNIDLSSRFLSVQ